MSSVDIRARSIVHGAGPVHSVTQACLSVAGDACAPMDAAPPSACGATPMPRSAFDRFADCTDNALLDHARDGHGAAFDVLCARHFWMLYRVAFRIAGDHHDAEDITQQALLAAWTHLSQFRGDAAVSTWLYRIAYTRALNHVHRADPATHHAELGEWIPDSGHRPAAAVEHHLSRAAIRAAVAALPSMQRRVTVLRHFEGLSYTQIAEATSTTIPAVRSHLFRARRTLANTLAQWA